MELFSPKKLLQALLCSYLLSAVLLLATGFFPLSFPFKGKPDQTGSCRHLRVIRCSGWFFLRPHHRKTSFLLRTCCRTFLLSDPGQQSLPFSGKDSLCPCHIFWPPWGCVSEAAYSEQSSADSHHFSDLKPVLPLSPLSEEWSSPGRSGSCPP